MSLSFGLNTRASLKKTPFAVPLAVSQISFAKTEVVKNRNVRSNGSRRRMHFPPWSMEIIRGCRSESAHVTVSSPAQDGHRCALGQRVCLDLTPSLFVWTLIRRDVERLRESDAHVPEGEHAQRTRCVAMSAKRVDRRFDGVELLRLLGVNHFVMPQHRRSLVQRRWKVLRHAGKDAVRHAAVERSVEIGIRPAGAVAIGGEDAVAKSELMKLTQRLPEVDRLGE